MRTIIIPPTDTLPLCPIYPKYIMEFPRQPHKSTPFFELTFLSTELINFLAILCFERFFNCYQFVTKNNFMWWVLFTKISYLVMIKWLTKSCISNSLVGSRVLLSHLGWDSNSSSLNVNDWEFCYASSANWNYIQLTFYSMVFLNT